MKNKNQNQSVDSLYVEYRDTRDLRPSADLNPMLTAANDAFSPVKNANVRGHELDQSWEESEEFKAVSLLYREWKASRVTPRELDEIRERIVNETLAVARVRAQMPERAPSDATVAKEGMLSKVTSLFTSRGFNLGFAPAAAAAILAAVVLILVPLDNETGIDTASLAGVSVFDDTMIKEAGDSAAWISAGPDSSFGFSKSTSRQGRAFGLGVGSMDLVMALRSGNADKTLEVTRHLVGLSQSQDLGNVKTSATAVFDEISLRPEISRVVFSRSMHLLTEMKNAFVTDDERRLFELGQWVEAVYLLSSRGIESGDTTSLRQTLSSASERLATGAQISGLSKPVSTGLVSLSQINASDGVVLAEARLARDLSARIKLLVE